MLIFVIGWLWSDPPEKLFQGPLRPPMFNGHVITQEQYDGLLKAFSGTVRGSDAD